MNMSHAQGIEKMVWRFVDAILEPDIRELFVHMPSEQDIQKNIRNVWQKYKLKNVMAGIDGCHFSFREKPRWTYVFISVKEINVAAKINKYNLL